MPSTSRQFLFASALLAMVVVLTIGLPACEQRNTESPPPATSPTAETPKPVLWQRVKDATVVAVNDPDIESQLAQAMVEAQRSADDARHRWTLAKPEERALWAVKWAAPLTASSSAATNSRAAANNAPADADRASDEPIAARRPPATTTAPRQPTADTQQPESVEHVWVQPINWSPFRIEGVLLSEPLQPLDCGRTTGEIVSFPIDELSDWIHFATDPASSPDTPFEGGYTVKVLEEKYGKP